MGSCGRERAVKFDFKSFTRMFAAPLIGECAAASVTLWCVAIVHGASNIISAYHVGAQCTDLMPFLYSTQELAYLLQ